MRRFRRPSFDGYVGPRFSWSSPSGSLILNLKPKGVVKMRFMILVKADKNTEAGVLPDEKLLTEMGKFNEELAKAGVLLAGEGLQPSSKGARVRFSGERRTVIDGPFAETKELIAGFWLWQVNSKEEAIEWVKRCPNPTGAEGEIEIRQVFEDEEFAEAVGQEAADREAALRKAIAGLARMVRDVGLAEELAQDALVAALEQWPSEGVPRNPGAWLMAIGKRRAIDRLRREERLERKLGELG